MTLFNDLGSLSIYTQEQSITICSILKGLEVNASRQRIVSRLLENNMIKIKLATPIFFFWGGGGLASDYLAKGWSGNTVLLNALIDSQAMVERMVWYITAKLAGDNLESGSAIRHLHISYSASYLPTPLPPPPLPKKKRK